MTVFHTQALAAQFSNVGASIVPFVSRFTQWKTDWPSREFTDIVFGKDGSYSFGLEKKVPSGDFRHVHLVPLADEDALKTWNRQSRKHPPGKKVSNRVLVYSSNSSPNARGGRSAYPDYLLIYILDEPDAHDITKMQTDDDRTLMLKLAKVAETWALNGQILI